MRKDKVVSEVLGGESALSPSDLYTKDFPKAVMGGYKPQAVHRFLDRVADQFEALIERSRVLKEENDAIKAELADYRKMETTLRGALTSSQDLGEDMLQSARREAQALLREARTRMAQAEFEAHEKSATLARDIQRLHEQRNRLRIELLSILESHRVLVDSLLPEEGPHALVSLVDASVRGRGGVRHAERAPATTDESTADGAGDAEGGSPPAGTEGDKEPEDSLGDNPPIQRMFQ